MAGSMDVEVHFGSSVSFLHVKDYADLTAQTRSSLTDLPDSFIFSHKEANKTRIIDCQRKLRLLIRKQPLALRVIQSPELVCVQKTKPKPMLGDVQQVKIANKAFINYQKDAVAPTKEVINIDESPPTDDRCPVCIDSLKKPMKAKCGHKCCYSCWDKVLSKFLECPVCRAHARMKTLRAC